MWISAKSTLGQAFWRQNYQQLQVEKRLISPELINMGHDISRF